MVKRNRVVITGIGVLAPNGIGLEAFWDSLLHCRSGIGPITFFDASEFKSQVAGEIKDFDPFAYIEPELKPKRMARHTQLAYAATMMALKDAGMDIANMQLPSPTPVIIGVSMNAMDVLERALAAVRDFGPNRAAPSTSGASMPQAAANVIADRIGISADAATVSSACPSGLDAVAEAVTSIRLGETEIAIAGGTDAPVTPLVMASLIAGGLCGESNGDPAKVSRPFDSCREHGVLSEGACVFIIENAEHAESRGAHAYLEIRGYAKRRDRDPSKPGSGLVDSMKLALSNAGRSVEDVDYISAYGPSDRVLDAAEVQFIKRVFGPRAYAIPVTSIKGVTGNPLAAGGPLQLAACALTIRDQIIAPTANFENGDDSCDLDFVASRPRRTKVDCALINVRGLGGGASTMVVSRYPAE